MRRRTAIRNIAIITAGAAFLPACRNAGTPGIALKNISVSGQGQHMLAELAEAIIPKTSNYPGAKELKSHEFILTMIDDCTSPEDQEKFIEGLEAFDKLSHDKFGQKFTGYTSEQKNLLLSDIERKRDIPEDALKFYVTVKGYTLQSFTSSKAYMIDVKKYRMAPGAGFKGCVPVKNV